MCNPLHHFVPRSTFRRDRGRALSSGRRVRRLFISSYYPNAVASPVVEPGTRRRLDVKSMPPYHVVLLNDDHHSVDYVVGMLKDLFGHPPARGARMAREVHLRGRVIVATTNLEEAELKCEQIQSFGPDPLVDHCKGSMSAVVEPASE